MVIVNTRAPIMKVDITVPVMMDIDSWKISSLVRVGLQCLHIHFKADRQQMIVVAKKYICVATVHQ